jgi:hypothetical protein
MESIPAILRTVWLARKDRNRRYSLRAFARQLQLSPSFLHEILHGKKRLSRRTAERVASTLKFDTELKDRFIKAAKNQFRG